ncbi:MAG: 2'-5' RNA ligase family protein [Betaproteobacteria bacterium]|nr:2'-5' RNA ligase family protein [Betaproteobacteria bacterium]
MPPGRRNVRKLTLRPPLPRCAIVWFPPFPVDCPIEPFRRRHDPLADALPAHVTLVFPFPTSLTVTQIASHIRRIVGNWPALPVTFRDVESIVDEFVVLMLRERSDAIIALHDKLYRGILKSHLRDDITYEPHVTLGRVAGNPSQADFTTLHDIATREVRGEWRCVLRELAVVTLHVDGKISIDKTIPLNFA